jgi:type IV secretion system protein VirD4
VLPPPDLRNRSVAVGGLRPSDDWSDLTPAATSGPSDASDNHGGDPANAGIRREPELPEQEEIVPPPPAPVQEFDLLDDEADVDAAQARAIRQRMRMVARQVAMNPDDGIEL